jgi:hypothetical protein
MAPQSCYLWLLRFCQVLTGHKLAPCDELVQFLVMVLQIALPTTKSLFTTKHAGLCSDL